MNKSKVKRLAKELKLSKKIPLSELKQGIAVEKEHGPKSKGGVSKKTDVTKGNIKKTAKIAGAHLMEDPRYYDYLEKMEKKLERKASRGKKMSSRKKGKTKKG